MFVHLTVASSESFRTQALVVSVLFGHAYTSGLVLAHTAVFLTIL